MKQLAILLTCHNRREKTLACLKALYQVHLPVGYAFEVFLVDDGSTDGTGEAVKAAYPNVHVIRGSGQLYWNRGMHLAWQTAARHAHYNFYLWLNDDTYLFTDALTTLLQNSEQTQHRALICGSTVSPTTGQITYGGRLINGQRVLPQTELAACDYINGNCVLIPQWVYNTVGQLDQVFIHAIGDFDYGLRVKKAGLSVMVASQPIGHCEANNSLPQWCLPQNPLQKRLKNLYSPLGNSHPVYYFKFEKRHFGLPKALYHFVTIHVRVLCPRLWKH